MFRSKASSSKSQRGQPPSTASQRRGPGPPPPPPPPPQRSQAQAAGGGVGALGGASGGAADVGAVVQNEMEELQHILKTLQEALQQRPSHETLDWVDLLLQEADSGMQKLQGSAEACMANHQFDLLEQIALVASEHEAMAKQAQEWKRRALMASAGEDHSPPAASRQAAGARSPAAAAPAPVRSAASSSSKSPAAGAAAAAAAATPGRFEDSSPCAADHAFPPPPPPPPPPAPMASSTSAASAASGGGGARGAPGGFQMPPAGISPKAAGAPSGAYAREASGASSFGGTMTATSAASGAPSRGGATPAGVGGVEASPGVKPAAAAELRLPVETRTTGAQEQTWPSSSGNSPKALTPKKVQFQNSVDEGREITNEEERGQREAKARERMLQATQNLQAAFGSGVLSSGVIRGAFEQAKQAGLTKTQIEAAEKSIRMQEAAEKAEAEEWGNHAVGDAEGERAELPSTVAKPPGMVPPTTPPAAAVAAAAAAEEETAAAAEAATALASASPVPGERPAPSTDLAAAEVALAETAAAAPIADAELSREPPEPARPPPEPLSPAASAIAAVPRQMPMLPLSAPALAVSSLQRPRQERQDRWPSTYSSMKTGVDRLRQWHATEEMRRERSQSPVTAAAGVASLPATGAWAQQRMAPRPASPLRSPAAMAWAPPGSQALSPQPPGGAGALPLQTAPNLPNAAAAAPAPGRLRVGDAAPPWSAPLRSPCGGAAGGVNSEGTSRFASPLRSGGPFARGNPFGGGSDTAFADRNPFAGDAPFGGNRFDCGAPPPNGNPFGRGDPCGGSRGLVARGPFSDITGAGPCSAMGPFGGAGAAVASSFGGYLGDSVNGNGAYLGGLDRGSFGASDGIWSAARSAAGPFERQGYREKFDFGAWPGVPQSAAWPSTSSTAVSASPGWPGNGRPQAAAWPAPAAAPSALASWPDVGGRCASALLESSSALNAWGQIGGRGNTEGSDAFGGDAACAWSNGLDYSGRRTQEAWSERRRRAASPLGRGGFAATPAPGDERIRQALESRLDGRRPYEDPDFWR